MGSITPSVKIRSQGAGVRRELQSCVLAEPCGYQMRYAHSYQKEIGQ
jgi:hypothetical protein